MTPVGSGSGERGAAGVSRVPGAFVSQQLSRELRDPAAPAGGESAFLRVALEIRTCFLSDFIFSLNVAKVLQLKQG